MAGGIIAVLSSPRPQRAPMTVLTALLQSSSSFLTRKPIRKKSNVASRFSKRIGICRSRTRSSRRTDHFHVVDARLKGADRAGRCALEFRSCEGGSATAQRSGGSGHFDDRVGQSPHGADENFHDSSVKLGIGAALQLGESVWRTPGLLVRAVAGDRIVGISDGDNARSKRNALSGQGLGVAGAVKEFVVVQYHFANTRERREGIENLRAKRHV